MSITFMYSQLGAFFLGITFVLAVLWRLAAGQSQANGGEGCMSILLCTIGASLTVACYIAAVNA